VSDALVSYYVDGDLILEEALNASISPGETYVHVFSSIDGLTGDDHTVFAVVTENNDENISDDATKTEANFMTGTETLTVEELNIYPNPSNGQFSAEVDDSLLGAVLNIVDIHGKLITNIKLDQPKTTFNLDHQGIYMAIVKKTNSVLAPYGKIVVF